MLSSEKQNTSSSPVIEAFLKSLDCELPPSLVVEPLQNNAGYYKFYFNADGMPITCVVRLDDGGREYVKTALDILRK